MATVVKTLGSKFLFQAKLVLLETYAGTMRC